MTQPDAATASPAVRQPVARVGLAVMGGLLLTVLAMGTWRNGIVQALGDLGFRSPPIAMYTLLLLSPLGFETAYPYLRRLREGTRARNVVENLHAHAPYLILVAIVMLVMRIENVWDLAITSALGYDLTPLVHAMEGDVVGEIQRQFRHPALDLWFVFVYVTVYALYHAVAMVWFAATGRTRLLKAFTLTWCGIYLVALPFYVFVPVNEAWVTNAALGCGYDYAGSPVGILNTECGAAGGIVYAISSINNCFPSLHNAFAWALPFMLWRMGHARAARWLSLVAVSVSASTVYLGIHWLTDVAAGILLSWFVTGAAVRIRYDLSPRLGLQNLRWTSGPSDP